MPPRNAPLPNAVNLFNCNICDKGYPRQVDYENHLRSYDHNHRQRLAEMKKLTAANEGDSSNRPSKGPLDMRSIPVEDSGKKGGLGPRFKKIGGVGAVVGGGSRFKKVGVAVSGSTGGYEGKSVAEPVAVKIQKAATTDDAKKVDMVPAQAGGEEPSAKVVPEKQADTKKDEDVVMGENDGDHAITWEEYDFTKPTDCDHVNCQGCRPTTMAVDDNGWLVVGSA